MLQKENLILLIFIFCFTSSCKEFSQSIEETLQENEQTSHEANSELNQSTKKERSSKTAKRKTIFTEDTEALRNAENSLRNLPEFVGKSIYIYGTIHFYENHRISLKIQNPENPKYVDEYDFVDGNWDKPKPVRLSKDTQVEKDLVNLNEIPFTNARKVYQTIKEKQKEIGDTSENLTVYAVVFNQEIRWYPMSIASDRYEYSLEFEPDGTLKSFEQK